MLKGALFSVGILAVFLTWIFPAGDLCALTASADHACCAEPEAETTSSCCSGDEGSEARTDVGQVVGCDCVHAPSTPVTTVPAKRSVSQEDGQATIVAAQTSAPGSSTKTRTHSIGLRVRSHPPPPVFLLDCSFLI